MEIMEAVRRAVKMGETLKHLFVATADPQGLPHLAAAGKIDLTPQGEVAVSAWFCPGTLDNLRSNPKVSLVIWDPENDLGHQLLGRLERLEEVAMLDGYDPEAPVTPQVERRMVVRVERVLAFSHAPHSDAEE